jgi:predicted RNA-binding protein with PIN domain
VKLLIDGYNLIRQSPALGASFEADPETSRRELIELLALYQKKRRHAVTLVFDGTGSPNLSSQSSRQAGIKIVFSAQGRTADELIARRARELREGAVVVTSDQELARTCQGFGAQVMSSPQFEAHLYRALTDDPEAPEDEDAPRARQSTRKRGPAKRAKKRDRQRQRRLEKL